MKTDRGTSGKQRPAVTLIDTSAWIPALRKGGSTRARNMVSRLIAENRAATAGIIKLELLAGTKTEKEYRELKEELEALVQLQITTDVWDRASHIAYRLRRKGVTVPTVDALIAALAAENDCKLLHADRHFDLMIPHGIGPSSAAVISLLE